MDFSLRPKSDYLNQASFADLVALTGHWLSDLVFYGDEIKFLKHLVDKYFIWLTQEKYITSVEMLMVKLNEFSKVQQEFLAKSCKHYRHLEELEENPFSHDEQCFREEHSRLEDDIARFTKAFRVMKQEVISLSEEAISEEKLNHLLAS